MADGRGDPHRPFRHQPPRAVVVAHDPHIREGWARSLEATGMEVARCAGPTVSCALLRGDARCALLDAAGLALYQEALLTEPFLTRLAAARPAAMVVATRDRHHADGAHEPAMSHVVVRSAV
ncbi:MAG TPA: hypothetical protein VE261_07800 [Gaiellaceae bacterium]|nr:hypothetical protein [Gaiellaceae bacterium]